MIAVFISAFSDPASGFVTQFVPTVSVSEVYTDNYNQTEKNREGEFSTEYMAGFDFEFIETRKQINFSYNVSYMNYDEHHENDFLNQNLNLTGLFNLARHTDINFVETFTRTRDISQRTGTWEDHDLNVFYTQLNHQFGERDFISLDFSYSFNKYNDPNLDEYESFHPSGTLSYWFNRDYGLVLSCFYELNRFDLSNNREETFSGDIRFVKQISRHFLIYSDNDFAKSRDDFEKHTIYAPSLGFEWTLSESSNISMGAGMMFNNYANQQDTRDFFLDLNIFKIFNLNRRTSFAISAASGRGETGEDSASLGYRVYYRGGVNFHYALTREAGLDISSFCSKDDFIEQRFDRTDYTFNVRTGFTFTPLDWLSFVLSWSYTDFRTNADTRDDFAENQAALTVTLTPLHPGRLQQRESIRESVETRIFER